MPVHYSFQNIPDYFRAYEDREWFGYVMALTNEEMDDMYPDSWYRSVLSLSDFAPLLRHYWPQVIHQFMGWLDRHPDYVDEQQPEVIHGVESARRAFDAFYQDSHEALCSYLEYLASREHHEPMPISEILPKILKTIQEFRK